MTVSELLGVAGISSVLGVVVSKLFDIIWAQNKAMRIETVKWPNRDPAILWSSNFSGTSNGPQHNQFVESF